MLEKRILVCLLVLAFSLSLLSAAPNMAQTRPLSQIAEAQMGSGDDTNCQRAWGLGLSLAAAALSPCSVLCAVFAWYDLALIAAYC